MRWSPRVDIEPANCLPADACRVACRVAARRSGSVGIVGVVGHHHHLQQHNLFFYDALATCWMRVCSGVHARAREQSDRRSRVASTRKRKRHRSVQSGTRSEATPVTRVLRPPDKSVQSEPDDASASGVCSIELSTRSCLASEPTAQGTGASCTGFQRRPRVSRRHGSTSLCRAEARDACAGRCAQVLATRMPHRRARNTDEASATRYTFTDRKSSLAEATWVLR